MTTQSITKRDLSLAMDVSSDNETSKSKSVKYPVRQVMGASPKDYLVIYDGDYRQAGLAYLLDIADKFRFADATHESDVNRLFGAYAIKHRTSDGKIDLPIYIGASQIVYCLSNGKPLSGLALYGLAWSSMRWTSEHVERLRSLSIHKTVKSKATV